MTFECTVKKGHTGAGKFNEVKIYVNAANILQAMNIARNRGGVKKGRGYTAGQSILSIKQVQ